MDNIRATIDTLFSQINSSTILTRFFGNNKMDGTLGVTEEMFCQKFVVENKCYTLDQVHELYHLFISEWTKNPLLHLQDTIKDKDLFYVLLHYTTEVLTEIDQKPVCKYAQLLRWRTLVYKLGEDLFTTSHLAFSDIQLRTKRNNFDWPPVIAQDNPAIDYLLRKGVTDLHFHLRGSSLNYELNWISLMNNIQNRKADFTRLRKCLSHRISTIDKEKWDSFYLSTIKACAIRYYFFLTVRCGGVTSDFKKKIFHILYCDHDALVQNDGFIIHLEYLQRCIERTKHQYGYKKIIEGKRKCIDYAIPSGSASNDKEPETILSGERYLLYSLFHKIYSGQLSCEEKSLFYVYLLQKEQLRKELVQLNELEGFANFSDYERRKELFIENRDEYQNLVPKLAIDMAFASGHLKYLECRITPKNTYEELYKSIYTLEKQINGSGYYYILHFIKKKDDKNFTNQTFSPVRCRHFQLRHEIRQQGMATLEGMRKSSLLGKRIIGIDSANTELYCRPEVFGPIYRYMKHFSNRNNSRHKTSLKFTYHVGEDSWDIADGLRAIDEAVLFLNLSASDRLGHALVLGTNVEAYYRNRNCRVVMSKQHIIDNAMWLLQKARELKISLSNNVSLELQEIFNQFYHKVYLNEDAKDFWGREQDGKVEKEFLELGKDINLYYQSWLLRGDDPEVYKTNKNAELRKNNNYSLWGITAINTLNENIVKARKQDIACCLYRNYHYNPYVRQTGDERYEWKLSSEIICLIGQIQHKMCHQIAALHLGIEGNITSNQLIGSMNKYIQHPIVKLYQLGLSLQNVGDCPQMSVSINTDDRGLFDTSIDEEYALLALALEKEIDENHHPRYQPRYIYEWLNNIRKMGFEQQFNKQDASKY